VRFDGESQTISFDVSARAQRDRAALCSRTTYRVSELVEMSDDSAGGTGILRFSVDDARCVLTTDAQLASSGVKFPTVGTGLTKSIFVGDLETGPDTPPDGITVRRDARWQYRIEVAQLP
jgi:hypothetical protein